MKISLLTLFAKIAQQTHPRLQTRQIYLINNFCLREVRPTECLPAAVTESLILPLHSYMTSRANRVEKCLRKVIKAHNGNYPHRCPIGYSFFRVNRSASLSHFRHHPKVKSFQTVTPQTFCDFPVLSRTQVRENL